ncbi:hypothetical protein BTU51_0897 [Rickettsia rickettsii]|uniref:Uncharacterized protein n=1 Tax=Rickettsia rickettsii (strain Iowa) TaxID=452659 RepID=B0BXZ9_RICRO|nr:hypothetical protein RrIowa_0897 [Rickettsia rickettsii str. Iowa]APU55675.1 hypothetical protein BTU50_0897 [Rickettsia rickettsii]APU57052.1 hypothetical protein BTU51_0897 [Rickettsia rickettsii]
MPIISRNLASALRFLKFASQTVLQVKYSHINRTQDIYEAFLMQYNDQVLVHD